MKFNIESPWTAGEAVDRLGPEERRKAAIEILGKLEGTYESWLIGDEAERLASALPDERRDRFLKELADIAEQNGWKTTHQTLLEARTADRRVRRAVGAEDNLYPIDVRRPDQIQDINGFFIESKEDLDPSEKARYISYWMPTKRDIRRCAAIALAAGDAERSTGPVRILDVGGGSGFISRLINDELRDQRVECETTVIDPDQRVINTARALHRDCPSLRFMAGTAQDAVAEFAPRLDTHDRARVSTYERQMTSLKQEASERLGPVMSALETITTWTTLKEAFATPYGHEMRTVFRHAGILMNENGDEEERQKAQQDLQMHFEREFTKLQGECIRIKNRIEEIYAMRGERQPNGPHLILNSWMPSYVDFTRELRVIGAPAILYATERGGATGICVPDRTPLTIADESSYEPGRNYRSVKGWQSLATIDVHRGTLHGYTGSSTTEIQVHLRKNARALDRFAIPSVPDTDRYPWEQSLEQLIGKETMRQERYAHPIDQDRNVQRGMDLMIRRAISSGRLNLS